MQNVQCMHNWQHVYNNTTLENHVTFSWISKWMQYALWAILHLLVMKNVYILLKKIMIFPPLEVEHEGTIIFLMIQK